MNTRNYRGGIGFYAVFSFLLFLLASCATYYQKNEDLMKAVYKYNFDAANKILADDEKWEKQNRNRLLFYLNKGTVLWMQGDYTHSKDYFAKADLFVEDYNKKIGDAVLSMLVNAKLTTYGGENFEQILLHYYGAMNYLALGKTDEALVEGKRMLEKMQKITDKYQFKNKYKRDAFAHHLLGIIYEMKGEYNDAFIAYKNAYEVYKDDYLVQLNMPIPLQLKKDLLRMALAVGFYDDVRKYEAEFSIKAQPLQPNKGDLIFFWNNGLGPIKDQNSFNIMIMPQGNGVVQFVNPELGISMPFQTENKDQQADLLDMKFIRLALPKYVSRLPYYDKANLIINQQIYPFEMVEDINAIAYKSLQDRMGRELALGLIRVAMKQLAVHKASKNKDQQGLAAAAMLYGAVSEQADTRNWQLLPYSINYSRTSLDTGEQVVQFEAYHQSTKGAAIEYKIHVKPRRTEILTIHTMEFSGYGK